MIDLKKPIDIKFVGDVKQGNISSMVKLLVDFEAGSLNGCLTEIAKNVDSSDWQLLINNSKILT